MKCCAGQVRPNGGRGAPGTPPWAWLPRADTTAISACAGPAPRCRAAGSAHALSMRYRNRQSPRSSGSIGSAPGPIEPNHSVGEPVKTRRYGRSLSSGSNVSISIPVNSIAISFSTNRASSRRIRFVVLFLLFDSRRLLALPSSRNTTAPYRTLCPALAVAGGSMSKGRDWLLSARAITARDYTGRAHLGTRRIGRGAWVSAHRHEGGWK